MISVFRESFAMKFTVIFFVCTVLGLTCRADPKKPVTLASVPDELEKISEDEALLDKYSPEKAARYLDRAALTWQKKKKCATCHTNMPYLMARPALSTVLKDSGEVRSFFEDYPKVRWAKRKPSEKQGFWAVVVATGLTFHDLQTTGKLGETAREALDTMWTTQRENGAWRWPDCDYAPMEIDDHYGATLAAVTVGIAPDDYANTAAAKAGLEKLRDYFKNDPPKSLHHRAMLAWCSKRIDGIVDRETSAKTLSELLALQLPDGGWSTSSFLTDWKGLEIQEGRPLKTKTSDGYGTGFCHCDCQRVGRPGDRSPVAKRDRVDQKESKGERKMVHSIAGQRSPQPDVERGERLCGFGTPILRGTTWLALTMTVENCLVTKSLCG